MNKLLLKLVMLPYGLWRSMGADMEQLNAILTVRLMMDDRKPLTMGRQRQKKKETKNGSIRNMLLYFVMGLIYVLPLQLNDRIFALTLYFSLFLLMLTLTLITDFSNVMFDSRDKFIIFPRPVSDRTLVVSRLLHVFIYLIRIVIPMSLPGWIALGVQDGWKSVAIFIFPLILMIFIAIFFVNGLYLLILRLAKPERFKEVINYFQIAFSIAFFATCYLLPRVFENGQVLNMHITDHPLIRFAPSYWLAACWSWIGFPSSLAYTKLYSVLAVIFPLVCLYVMVKWLSPKFAVKISAIDAVSSGETIQPVTPATTKTVRKAGPAKTKIYTRVAELVNRSDAAKAGFIMAWIQTSRSRSFKMRVYPMFAYVPLYFIYLLTMNHRPLGEAFKHMTSTPSYILLLYLCTIVVMQALSYLTISDQYKAAWVYYAMPLEKPGKVMAGAFKAMWLKYCFPFLLILGIFIVTNWGPATILDVILASVNVTLYCTCIMRVGYRSLPFSILEKMNQGGAKVLKVFASMFIVGLLGVGHYLTRDILVLKLLFLALSSIALWLVWDSYINTTWADVRAAEE